MSLNAGNIIGAVIVTIVALIMVLLGASQFRTKDKPVGFYNVIDPPKKEEITDITMWNRKHGMIWIVYGICIELGFWLGYFSSAEWLEMIFMMGGVVAPLPFMIWRHKSLEKKYYKNL